MQETQSSYRSIMKATSLFGGVQVFKIIIAIIQSKIIALLLGPSGMGVIGLLNSNVGLISSLTNFGLGTSSVKNISEAYVANDNKKVALVVSVLRKLVWITGAFGAVLTIVLAPWLSNIAFGNEDYTLAFVWISITLLFNQLSSGQYVILQGMRKLKYLANANFTGSILGLIISAPIYYFYRIEGIVATIIITSFANMVRAWYFARKISFEKPIRDKKLEAATAKEMVKMGFLLSLSGLLATGTGYLLRIYISNYGNISEVGLYTAGFAIIESYVGLVFTAMATDYYPKLSGVNKDNVKVRTLVEQQATISLLILMPIIVVFLIFSPIIVQILYSDQFFSIEKMLNWAIVGMLFRAVSWSIGFILFAKSDSKLFIKTAFLFNILFLVNNVIGYYIWGLTGIGISFLINYIMHFIILLVITRKRYQLYFNVVFYRLFIIALLFVLIGFAVSFIPNVFLKYPVGIVVIIVSIFYAMRELDKRLDLKSLKNKMKIK